MFKSDTTAPTRAIEPIPTHPAGRVGYTPVEVAAMFAISRAKLYELIGSGELASFTIGRSRRIPAAAVNAFIADRLAEAEDQRAAG